MFCSGTASVYVLKVPEGSEDEPPPEVAVTKSGAGLGSGDEVG